MLVYKMRRPSAQTTGTRTIFVLFMIAVVSCFAGWQVWVYIKNTDNNRNNAAYTPQLRKDETQQDHSANRQPQPASNQLTAVPTEVVNLQQLPKSNCKSTTLNIVAHQDDDLLFLSPDHRL